jgi:hypothetical protein
LLASGDDHNDLIYVHLSNELRASYEYFDGTSWQRLGLAPFANAKSMSDQ